MYIASNGVKTAVILHDDEPLHPRRDQDQLGKMICWHRRYNLGDEHSYEDPCDFAEDLASKFMTLQNLFTSIQDEKIHDLRFVEQGNEFKLQTDYGIPGQEDWQDTGVTVDKDLNLLSGDDEGLFQYLLSRCNRTELIRLCEESGQVAILPLYLYDHSGLALSTGSFLGRAQHAEWDSGQVGYIYMEKDTAMKEMAMPTDQIRLSQRLSPILFTIPINPGQKIEEVMKANGYTHVQKEDVLNPNAHDPRDSPNLTILNPYALEMGCIYKKDYKLFSVEGLNPNNTLTIAPVATFNPQLTKLTEETWKSRALDDLNAEVKEYDSYLRGNVYGYRCFEGTEEVDSCWGFNPCGEDIREMFEEMVGDWGSELKEKMLHAGYVDEPDFDIDGFFDYYDFPEFRDSILEEVKSFICFEEETSVAYPFAVPADDLLSNKDGLLDDIVEELYKEHQNPDTERIYEAICEHAGISREVQPKISVEDLEPGKDYTADELMSILKKKPSLADQIAGAAIRKNTQTSSREGPPHEFNR